MMCAGASGSADGGNGLLDIPLLQLPTDEPHLNPLGPANDDLTHSEAHQIR